MAARSAIGVDLGGTKILAGVVDEHGNVGDTRLRPTPTESTEVLLDTIAELVRELTGPGIDTVGMGIPARIDQRVGVAVGAVNVPLHEVPIVAEMERRVGLRVAVENDASVATLAEHRL